MKILMFFPGSIDFLPPLMTSSIAMKKAGAQIKILAASGSGTAANYLECNDIKCNLLVRDTHPASRLKRAFLRLKIAFTLIKEKKEFKPECIWYHGPFAMEYALIPGINKNALIVAHAYELCDQKFLLKYISYLVTYLADLVIVPEINRLWYLKVKSRSKAKFMMIPNRPFNLEIDKNEEVGLTYQKFCKLGGNKSCTKFIIYQGAFMDDRCLKETIAAFKNLKDNEVGLILMGGNSHEPLYKELKQLAESDKRIVFFPRLPPPFHLYVAKECEIGLLLYRPNRLNNIYCAPNKIYEYASAGLCMIFPRYPGLQRLNDKYNLGETCDPEDPNGIVEAMKLALLRNKETSKVNCKKFLIEDEEPGKKYFGVNQELIDIMKRKLYA